MLTVFLSFFSHHSLPWHLCVYIQRKIIVHKKCWNSSAFPKQQQKFTFIKREGLRQGTLTYNSSEITQINFSVLLSSKHPNDQLQRIKKEIIPFSVPDWERVGSFTSHVGDMRSLWMDHCFLWVVMRWEVF